MKILGVMCSPRKRGNSRILLDEALNNAKECGAETEMIIVPDLDIKPCDGCNSCVNAKKCHINDDMQAIYSKIKAADGIIFSTPVYFLSVSAQAKTFIDRLYVLYCGCELANKVAGAIATATRIGHYPVWDFFNVFFLCTRMTPVDYVAGFGVDPGDVKRDKHAMNSARELGRLMTTVINKGYKWPEEYYNTLHMFVQKKYGVSMSPSGNRFEPL